MLTASTPRPSTAASSRTAAVETKRCTRCAQVRTTEEFSRKRNSRDSICKPCHRQLSKAHYEANKATSIKRAGERRQKVRAGLQEHLDKVRARQRCAVCGSSGQLVASVPEAMIGPAEVIRRERGLAELEAACGAATWYCRACVGRELGRGGAGSSQVAGKPSIYDCVLDVCDTELGFSEIVARVRKIRSATTQAIHRALHCAIAEGKIQRVRRGHYAPAFRRKARSA